MTEWTQPPFAGGMTLSGIPSPGFAKDGRDRSGMGPRHPEGVTMALFSPEPHGEEVWEAPWSCHLHLSRPSSALSSQELQPQSSRGQPGWSGGFNCCV